MQSFDLNQNLPLVPSESDFFESEIGNEPIGKLNQQY